jgi:hypothetical protein
MKKLEGKFDFDDAGVRSRVLSALGRRRGWQEIEAKDYKPSRTTRQNRYYWSCFCELLADHMSRDGKGWTREMAHETFRTMYLQVSDMDEQTGRILTRPRSTTELTTSEFNEYLDKIAAMLAGELGLIVPEPAEYREAEDELLV